MNSKQIIQTESFQKSWRYDATCHKVIQNIHSRHFPAFAHGKTSFLNLFPASLGAGDTQQISWGTLPCTSLVAPAQTPPGAGGSFLADPVPGLIKKST